MGPLVRDPQLALLESLLFAADEPLTPRRLASLLKVPSTETIRRMIQRLRTMYDAEDSALQLVELAGGVQLRTREKFVSWLLKLQPAPQLNLSPAARETLTMIAYKQPITRADLEALRGVSCIDALRTLLEKGLIRIIGRDKSLGRPVLYGTTRLFLETVGLSSLDALPKLSD
jgi:segregation and condensation protein B